MRHLAVAASVASLIYSGCACFAQQSEFDRALHAYGNLETVAGQGKDEDGNFWNPEFEGASAAAIELSNPHMTMADQDGNLYIADKESHSILKVDTHGVITTAAGTHTSGFNGEGGVATDMQLNAPNGLHVLANGTFYVLDFLNRRVRRVDRFGVMTTVIHDTAGFGPGRGLWVSPDESTIFYNGPGRVMRWTAATGSEEYAGGLLDPGNITADPAGHLVVTDRAANVVYRMTEDGARSVIAGDGTDAEPINGRSATNVGLESARGIAFRPDGSYFVCTQKGGDIVFVDSIGIANIFIAGRGRGNTRAGDGFPPESPGEKISEPRAVTLAPNGDLIITTNDKGFVRVVRAIPPPRALNISRGGDGTTSLTWDTREGLVVDVESGGGLDSWAPEATDLDTGIHQLETQAGTRSFYRLRAHRMYPGQ